LILPIGLVALLIMACDFGLPAATYGSGQVIARSWNVREFDSVELNAPGTLYIEQTGQEALTVEGEDTILARLSVAVAGHTLTLGVAQPGPRTLKPTRPLVYHLQLKTLRALTITGDGQGQVAGLRADHLTLTNNGTGDLAVAGLTAASLRAVLAGAGTIQAAGTVTIQDVVNNSAGDYRADSLISESARVRVNSSGSAAIRVRQTLDATIVSSGGITYRGDPVVEQSIQGTGQLVHQSK
jgi:hypothetical protein